MKKVLGRIWRSPALRQFIPSKMFLKVEFRRKMGYSLNLKDPKTFNEKLQWLKLYNRRPEYTLMVDKYAVRSYVADVLGEQHLIPLLGVWNNPDEIDFDMLPDKFVLKCNHNSGLGMCVCTDKSQIDVDKVKLDLLKGLSEDYYLVGREWVYKNVPRRIIAEKYMEDEIVQDSLTDYKVLCFNGEPRLIQVHTGRRIEHKQTFFDLDWNKLGISQTKNYGAPIADYPIERPHCLEEMLEKTKVLCDGIPHVRIDWYIVNGRLYFGEITFFDGGGWEPFDDEDDDLLLGSMIDLSKFELHL